MKVAGHYQDTSDVIKFGELPAFGPRVPARVISLIGPDRDLFLKGRRAESQSLGIGAFGYYRRVVEDQKGRLLDAIIDVARKTSIPAATIATLEAAQNETQFSKAVENVKDAIPDSLRIGGHNPLTLLHSALSKGVHEMTDEECLQRATEIRTVLFALADRIGQTLKEQAELTAALSRLLNP